MLVFEKIKSPFLALRAPRVYISILNQTHIHMLFELWTDLICISKELGDVGASTPDKY
jgi:hypothetical protein